MDHRAIFVDARLRRHDGELAITVIPAEACLAGPKAGIQMNYPNLSRTYGIAL